MIFVNMKLQEHTFIKNMLLMSDSETIFFSSMIGRILQNASKFVDHSSVNELGI
jgi:hypothetical protein